MSLNFVRLVTIAHDHLARRLQLHPTSMHVCCSCISPVDSLKQLQLTCKHICSCGVTSSCICYICLRPVVISPVFIRLVSTDAPDHQACRLQLHLTNCHVFISCILSACMSVTVSSYQHPCMLHLHLTVNCSRCIRPFAISGAMEEFSITSNFGFKTAKIKFLKKRSF